MTNAALRLVQTFTLAALVLLLSPAAALAHTGEGASTMHILTEVGLWGLGVAATLGLVTAIFWIRANWIRRHQP